MLLSALLVTLISMPVLATDQPLCVECHEDKASAPVAHYPAQEGLCEVCHTATQKHFDEMDPKEVTTRRDPKVCYECHEAKDLGKHIHPALQMSDESCISCHNPHGGEHPTLLKNKLPSLCFDCHDNDSFTKGKSVHKITMAGKSCARCHDAHSSNLPKMLPQTPEKLCLTCHNRDIKTAERVILNIKAKLDSASVHMVATECTECHSPHASDFDRLLTSQFSTSDYNRYFPGDGKTPNTYALCFKCHDVALLDRNKAIETNFRSDLRSGQRVRRVNLHWVHVTNATGTTGPDRGRSCKICHDPHGAPQDRLIRDRLFKGNVKLEFTATEHGGSCAKSCHSPKGYERIN